VAAAIVGWLIGFLTAVFYNMFARRLGGIKFELVEGEETLRQASAAADALADKQGEEKEEEQA